MLGQYYHGFSMLEGFSWILAIGLFSLKIDTQVLQYELLSTGRGIPDIGMYLQLLYVKGINDAINVSIANLNSILL